MQDKVEVQLTVTTPTGLARITRNYSIDEWLEDPDGKINDVAETMCSKIDRDVIFDVCPFDFAHTRHWCGHQGCRDS